MSKIIKGEDIGIEPGEYEKVAFQGVEMLAYPERFITVILRRLPEKSGLQKFIDDFNEPGYAINTHDKYWQDVGMVRCAKKMIEVAEKARGDRDGPQEHIEYFYRGAQSVVNALKRFAGIK